MACGNVHLAAADANVCHVAAGRFGHRRAPRSDASCGAPLERLLRFAPDSRTYGYRVSG